MKVTTILLNLALTATAIAAAIDTSNADVTKRACTQITDPKNPGRACVPTGCFGLTANACCTYKWNQQTAICL